MLQPVQTLAVEGTAMTNKLANAMPSSLRACAPNVPTRFLRATQRSEYTLC